MHSLPNTVRPAIAMIELIFAIVVMGIAMMSAPQLIATAAQSGYVSIEQEAVNEASSHLNNILSYLWDEQLSYVYESGNSYQAVLLSVSHGDGDLNISGQYYRKGTPARSARTFMRGDSTTYSASTIGWDSGESTKGDEDDIDDENDYKDEPFSPYYSIDNPFLVYYNDYDGDEDDIDDENDETSEAFIKKSAAIRLVKRREEKKKRKLASVKNDLKQRAKTAAKCGPNQRVTKIGPRLYKCITKTAKDKKKSKILKKWHRIYKG